ncbi:5-aminovalerate aminotransferase DavT [Hypsizygus marmoreus]|uniref:5-aminovalerate aminotransferase DavT n=1 Tax=Hypsizygus marmoreus TaxID=39966 RepID=A0A369JZX8_HYPMA|nr:5-aminovalerate aminotransferase DavT [Hypsizygus marmoreus]
MTSPIPMIPLSLSRPTIWTVRRSMSQTASVTTNGTAKSRDLSTSADDLYQLGQRHVTNGLGRLTEGIMVKGQGSYVEYEGGRKLLDFTSGIGVTSLGHCHPKVSQAAAEQCLTLVHAQCSIAFHKPYLQLVERLLPVVPHPSLDSFFFWNSGSEAVEAAIKLARVATGRQHIICMQGGYHGRTYGAMAVTKSKTIYSEGVFPIMPGVFSIPYPYWHQHGLPPATPTSTLVSQSLYQLELLLTQQTAPRDTAAIIIEPLLGEGGYVPAPPEFLKGLRDVCDKHGILLIIDEVQSGFARTGKYFMIEYSGVRPDILVIAKGLANGFPLSGVVSRKELTDKLKPGTMGGTYAGNAVSCAAAVAVADVFQEENILGNVQARSVELFDALNALRKDSAVSPYILDVRGTGLMVAVEFTSPNGPGAQFDPVSDSNSPKSLASRIVKKCIENGLLILTTSAYEVIRFIPALNITQEDLKKGADIFAESVRSVVKEG